MSHLGTFKPTFLMHFVGFCAQILVIKCYSSWLTLGVVPLAAVETSGMVVMRSSSTKFFRAFGSIRTPHWECTV
jgi:hypothetical protein